MVTIYSAQYHNRLVYILDEIFVHRLNTSYNLVHTTQEYLLASHTLRIHYSNQDLPGIQIPESGFLFGKLDTYSPPCLAQKDGITVLYPMKTGIGFDIIAMAFWCLSRLEEYFTQEKDTHGRIAAYNHFLVQEKVCETPILDIALIHFYKTCNLEVPQAHGIYPTLDIDMFYKYCEKGFKRNLLGFCKDLLLFKLRDITSRITAIYSRKDPWDVYAYLKTQLHSLKENVRIFIHTGNLGPYDKAIPIKNEKVKTVVSDLSNYFALGIHPSYAGGQHPTSIIEEKARLEEVLNKSITRSRQHFLRLQIPVTYRALLASGIVHDYTMGYAETIGFRAATALSFRWYDLEKDVTTSLIIHPFCIMDVSLKNYMQLSAIEAETRVKKMKQLLLDLNLPFCFIFHNESISNHSQWLGWRKVFETCL